MTSLRSCFTTRPGRRRIGTYCPRLEPLESRQLLSVLSPPTGLHDPVVARVARREFLGDNGHLSRADVINLLDVVDGTETAIFHGGQVRFTSAMPDPSATVTATQWTDLQTLAANPRAWGMARDVANLLGKAVGQNPANENYEGAPLLPTGQLTVGTPDTALQELVGKWFYGTDLPVLNEYGIPDTVVYEPAQGRVFAAHEPRANDIAQGWLGDCYFLSALAETARQSPGTITNMLINNHDGTYTVRFFELDAASGAWRPDYVTVNRELPVLQQSGQFAYADWYQDGRPTTYTDPKAVLWPALVEKAYAQLAEEGWSRSTGPGGSGVVGTPDDWNTNSYDALGAGSGVAVQQITGSSNTNDVGLATGTAADERYLEQIFRRGSLVTIGSLVQEPANTPTNAAGVPLIIPTHVYSLQAVDVKHGTFTLLNPLDDSTPYPEDGQRLVTLTWSQLKLYLNDFWVVAQPSHAPTRAVVP
jgi:hypothetical protein